MGAAGRQLAAVGSLGVRALLLHPLRRLVRGRAERGERRFLRNYAPEGLVPLSAADSRLQPAFMRCIACGLCDQVCPLVGRLGPAFHGPSAVALAHTRASPDLPSARDTLAQLPDACGSCRACVDACPTRVPLRELFLYARRHLAQLDEARPPALAPPRPDEAP